MQWSTLHQMETGVSRDAQRRRSREARRRRRRTLACLAACLAAALLKAAVLALAGRAARLGAAANEQCWPLAGAHVDAIVLVPSGRVLWKPRYAADDSPGDVIRAHETSVLCPTRRTRIRSKRLNLTHGPLGRRETFADKTAVCVAHFANYFTTGRC